MIIPAESMDNHGLDITGQMVNQWLLSYQEHDDVDDHQVYPGFQSTNP